MMDGRGERLLHEGEALLRERDLSRALALFDVAEAAGADPDRCSAGRWMVHILSGDFEGAWRESDAIRERGAPDPHRFWRGEAIEGRRVMLRCLHGFGDSVQMLRYAPKLRARAAKLTVEVAPKFVELARMFDGVDQVITWGEDAPVTAPAWDVQMEAMELPYFFRTRVEELPIASGYLRVPGGPNVSGAEDVLRVGLVWASGGWNPARSVPLEMLRPLLYTPGCEFWNLQGGAEVEQAAELCGLDNFHTDPGCAGSVLRLAEIIEGTDLVITPDTLAAHLAGAMGKPAWVMLQYEADWRWMVGREDSPWYPTLRLFRQERAGDWQSVVSEVQAELDSLRVRRGEVQMVSTA